MNKTWSELNKSVREKLGKSETFKSGWAELLSLRNALMSEMISLRAELSDEQFCACPFVNADGYHNKTIAYSI